MQIDLSNQCRVHKPNHLQKLPVGIRGITCFFHMFSYGLLLRSSLLSFCLYFFNLCDTIRFSSATWTHYYVINSNSQQADLQRLIRYQGFEFLLYKIKFKNNWLTGYYLKLLHTVSLTNWEHYNKSALNNLYLFSQYHIINHCKFSQTLYILLTDFWCGSLGCYTFWDIIQGFCIICVVRIVCCYVWRCSCIAGSRWSRGRNCNVIQIYFFK